MAMNPYAALVDDDGSDSGEDSPRALSVYDAGLGSDVATGYESPILDHYLPPGDPVESGASLSTLPSLPAPALPLIVLSASSAAHFDRLNIHGGRGLSTRSFTVVGRRVGSLRGGRAGARAGATWLEGPSRPRPTRRRGAQRRAELRRARRHGVLLVRTDLLSLSHHYPSHQSSLYLQSKPSNAPTLERAAPLAQAAAAPKGETSRVGYPIDWNNEFQRLLELPENTEDQKLKKYLELGALSKNFLAMAKRWGKVIIEESFLPPKYRTIMPIDIGGQAGGEKYIYCGPSLCYSSPSLLLSPLRHPLQAAEGLEGHLRRRLQRHEDGRPRAQGPHALLWLPRPARVPDGCD